MQHSSLQMMIGDRDGNDELVIYSETQYIHIIYPAVGRLTNVKDYKHRNEVIDLLGNL